MSPRERGHDHDLLAHRTWLGYVEKSGLVVSASALVAAEVYIDEATLLASQQGLLALFAPTEADQKRFSKELARKWDADEDVVLPSLAGFFESVLHFQASDLAGAPGGPALSAALEISLPEYGEVLSPTFAVVDSRSAGGYLLLVREEPTGLDLDRVAVAEGDDRRWGASPEARFERLLRETGTPIGVLANGTHLRLVYAPRGESSGHLTFSFKSMCEVAGRPLLGGLLLLLDAERLFTGTRAQKLPALLRDSRKHQNDVSTALGEQILGALDELVRGFQAADSATSGRLLGEALRDDPAHLYGGLLTTLMRLVFVLFAEDRGLLPTDPVFTGSYALTGLFERLRADDGSAHDTMGQRYGAWAQLLTLFRVLHDGASHGELRIPARSGSLFNPDLYPFLEGRPYRSTRSVGERLTPPRVADGTVYRVLSKLLYLDGERLSYSTLDVEHIGSVYEGMMGYTLEEAKGPSIAVRPDHVVIDLGAVLEQKPDKRVETLAAVKCKLAKPDAWKKARTVAELVSALGKKVSPRTPDVLPAGALYLQPTEERRRSGSHYTPRALTEPIVKTTLDPILAALVPEGAKPPEKSARGSRPPPPKAGPRAEQILGLKVADPAMGSGAFLVETCRYLGAALETAWHEHGGMPEIPLDEDPTLHARRLVAQRCLYGVDKNPFAVSLAKLSLWLFTLAKDHPFTFLDHAMKHGDSLVGLEREQIASFTWDLDPQVTTFRPIVNKALLEAEALRAELHSLGDSDDTKRKQDLLRDADEALVDVKLLGDLAIAAFFGADKDKERKKLLTRYSDKARFVLAGSGDRPELDEITKGLRQGDRGVPAFHWGIEFPEVFSRKNPGFDSFVGNPPFLGGKRISTVSGESFRDWLVSSCLDANSNADLVAYFFRRTFDLVRRGGTTGLIATNTIAQGDTRATGLRWICKHGGIIYAARKRVKWPSAGAAVIVSTVHTQKVATDDLSIARPKRVLLDDRATDRISAFLFHGGGDDDPSRLEANKNHSFIGCFLRGMGFTFDDTAAAATPLSTMRALIEKSEHNSTRIFPYLGGEEVNSSPTHTPHRYAINFGDATEQEARRWPDLMHIVEARVAPDRRKLSNSAVDRAHKQNWWRFANDRPELRSRTRGLARALAIPRVSSHLSAAFIPVDVIPSDQLVIIPIATDANFGIIQSRVHEIWARFFASTMGDGLRYTPSDCFETFPFPIPFDPTDSPAIEAHRAALEAIGKTYYEYRAALMICNNEGLTKTYNRFHDPEENDPEIQKLRDLHTEMDRAVLSAYGWSDIPTQCEFLLDYEEASDDDEEEGGKRRKKKPYRYRWPDKVRDEVLARLIALNQERAAEERRLGIAPRGRAKSDTDEDESVEAS